MVTKTKTFSLLTILVVALLVAAQCRTQPTETTTQHFQETESNSMELAPVALKADQKLKVVATTTVIGDLARNVGGDRVHVVGSVSPAEVARYYSLLDVVVYPRRSTRQTEMVTPLKPFEAMAMGKAVVASDVGGLREAVDAGTGAYFRAGDAADLARCCIELLSDPERRRRLGDEARARLAQSRSWSEVVAVQRRAYAEAARAAGCNAS